MKSSLSVFSTGAALVCLALAVWLFVVDSSNRKLRKELQGLQRQGQSQQEVLQDHKLQLQVQQQKINAGTTISKQVGPNLLRDMAVASTSNDKVKALLAKHGYNVQVTNDTNKDASTSVPTP